MSEDSKSLAFRECRTGTEDVRISTHDISSDPATRGDWHQSLAEAIRDPNTLVSELALPEELREPARRAAQAFPVMVPRSYLNRMRRADPHDPLLLQVLPLHSELETTPGFVDDAVDDAAAREAPGLLRKYAGRALMIATSACAVHCRYCFRRHYPYGNEPRRLDEWEPAFRTIAADESLREIILSGGDPLMLTDSRLGILISRLAEIQHLKRIRIHSRLPIVLPDRVTPTLIDVLRNSRLTPLMVVHANHPDELHGECAVALRLLVRSGITTLNQSVLLRNINDSVDVLTQLSERLIDLGVMPYYLHQLDQVTGTSHFEVAVDRGRELIAALRRRLPGYAVPQYVREVSGEPHKMPLI